MTTSNSSDNSRRAQLAPRNMSVKPIISQWDTITAWDLITLLTIERTVQQRTWQSFWERFNNNLLILDV